MDSEWRASAADRGFSLTAELGRPAKSVTTLQSARHSGSVRNRFGSRHFELVPKASKRLNVVASFEVPTDFAAQSLDVDIDRFMRAHVMVAPGELDQLVPAQYATRVLHQGMQQRQFALGESHPMPIYECVHLLEIQ